jgi:two-component system NtrC family response regulator
MLNTAHKEDNQESSDNKMLRNILVIEDDRVFNRLLIDNLTNNDYLVNSAASWQEAEAFLDHNEPDLILLDIKLPDADGLDKLSSLVPQIPTIILTAYGSVQNAVSAMQSGAADYLIKPINIRELELVIERVLENAAIRDELQVRKNIESRQGENQMVGESAALKRTISHINAVAQSDINVLIQGESGAGKELVAQAIHKASPRGAHTFVAVDCCTITEDLFESELFGHEKGAFTGAISQKKGLIEGAKEGTLFLDEIGEISPSIQAKLLRVIETGRFRRVGGTKNLRANVRILAATNRKLAEMSEQNRFRADLFYRLSTFIIETPPLRDRIEDIPLLVEHFLNNHKFSRRINVTVDKNALYDLAKYHWPGNVRELKNVIERAIILMGNDHKLTTDHLVFNCPSVKPDTCTMLQFKDEPTLEEIEEKYLKMMLSKYQGHRLRTAEALGISERTLYRLVKKYDK